MESEGGYCSNGPERNRMGGCSVDLLVQATFCTCSGSNSGNVVHGVLEEKW
jgi:hypothetical protein